MKNLGKIFLFLLLCSATLLAKVEASLDRGSIYSGEMVTYKLTISGEDIQKPTLGTICGNEIVATGSQTSIESINGKYLKTYTLSYQFMPQESCLIEPVSVSVNGEVQTSNPVELKVKEPSQERDAPFVISLKSSKESLYVGEPFEMILTLTQRADAEAIDSRFGAPDFKGFWIKSEDEPIRSDDGEKIVTTVVYQLAPQREGNITIKPAKLQVASRASRINSWGSFSPQVEWRSYFSNKLNLKVNAIPNGAKLIGDFKISANVTKTEIGQNEPLNLEIAVEGVGNLEDIKSFKPYINGVSVFDEEIVIKGKKLTQKMVFVSAEDFTIPAFELIYYNTKTKKVQKIQTEPIDIKVIGDAPKQRVEIDRPKSNEAPPVVEKTPERVETLQEPSSTLLIALFVGGLFIGIFLGMALLYFLPKLMKKKSRSVDISDEKLLLMKLLPYKEYNDVSDIIDILEKNIYSKEKTPLDKKELKELFKRHNIN